MAEAVRKSSSKQVRGRRAHFPITRVILLTGIVVAAAILLMPSSRKTTAPTPQASANQLVNCQTNPVFSCYETYLQQKVTAADPAAAFTDLRAVYDQDAYVKSECHQLAHVVGRAAYDKYGSIAKAYPQGDSFCWSGYHHGVTEKAIGALGAKKIKEQANELCKELADSKRYSFDHYNCVHGMGHGFLTVENANLFNALKACDLLTDNWEATSCYGGAFMENVMIDTREGGKSAYLRPNEPMYPCTAVDAPYKEQCYLMQTSYALKQNGYNFADAFRLCRDVADPAYTTTCYTSIGRDASGSTVSDIARTQANCLTAPDSTGIRFCMLGAVRDFVSYHHSDVQAKQLCTAFAQEYQAQCLQEVDTYYQTF